jgi:hypothetical protein
LATLVDKPAECDIVMSSDPGGVTLSWTPRAVRSDPRLLAFLVFWLCGWLVFFVYAVFNLLNGESVAFLVSWLGVWIVAGCLVMRALWAMLRSPLPESLRLETDVLQYDSGCRLQRRDKRVIEFARTDLYGVALEPVRERERLCLDLGDGWFEIGASLREAERKWMFAVLQQWYNAERNAPADGGRSSSSESSESQKRPPLLS